MEHEYIEREAAMRAARHAWGEGLEPSQYIEIIPAADVAPVVHGRWERRRNCWYCTHCGKGYKIVFGTVAASTHTFCPNCGARMDGNGEVG